MTKLIKNWQELAQVPPSKTHYLDIDTGYSGWVKRKDNNKIEGYMCTHTFYGGEHKHSTKVLQRFGFNVEIDNWDKEDD